MQGRTYEVSTEKLCLHILYEKQEYELVGNFPILTGDRNILMF
jgi:hypothetical protein